MAAAVTSDLQGEFARRGAAGEQRELRVTDVDVRHSGQGTTSSGTMGYTSTMTLHAQLGDCRMMTRASRGWTVPQGGAYSSEMERARIVRELSAEVAGRLVDRVVGGVDCP
jgi:hypothetical protein